MSKNRYVWLPLLLLSPPDGGVPWDDFRKIFRGCQRIAKVPNDVEKMQKIATGEVGCTNVTDDGRAIAYSEANENASSRSLKSSDALQTDIKMTSFSGTNATSDEDQLAYVLAGCSKQQELISQSLCC